MKVYCPHCGVMKTGSFCSNCGAPLYSPREVIEHMQGKIVHMWIETDEGPMMIDVLPTRVEGILAYSVNGFEQSPTYEMCFDVLGFDQDAWWDKPGFAELWMQLVKPVTKGDD